MILHNPDKIREKIIQEILAFMNKLVSKKVLTPFDDRVVYEALKKYDDMTLQDRYYQYKMYLDCYSNH